MSGVSDGCGEARWPICPAATTSGCVIPLTAPCQGIDVVTSVALATRRPLGPPSGVVGFKSRPVSSSASARVGLIKTYIMTLLIDQIPDELKQTSRWVVWKWVTRDGKPTKPPFNPATGKPGDATDPALWMDFETALTFLPRYEGLGYAVTADSPYTGVDLDHSVDETGLIDPSAEAVVRRLDSYTEGTPSGRGLRVWVRGKLPPGRRRKGNVEMYDAGRYFTITGARIAGVKSTIENREKVLADLHAEMFPPSVQSEARPPLPVRVDLSDREILDRMFRSRNGAAIEALYCGDRTRHASGSEADLALCSHLAYWFGGDVLAIDRVFRTSALMRDKWERFDYREATITKALEGVTEFYVPSRGANGRVVTLDSPTNVGPDVPDREPGVDGPDDNGEPFNRTDLGNARRLVMLHGDNFRYCHPWAKWLEWTGQRWRFDETGAIVRAANAVVQTIHVEAVAEVLESKQKALSVWAMKSEGEPRVNAMVSLARNEEGIPIMPAQIDAPPHLLNCPNGTLNLTSGQFGPHIRSDLLSKCTSTPFVADAACPVWDTFLRTIMNEDASLMDFLQRAVGYSLTGNVSEHAMFFLFGKGRNGKSTFLNTVQHVLGDYAITVNGDLLTAKNQDEHPTGVADLMGRRFVATIEVEDGRKMAESLVKTLTGGDRIRARRMRSDFFEFDPTHKLWMAANHKPIIRGTDDGIWRRIKLIPFAVQIPDELVDRNLSIRLHAEASGILAWAVRGCFEWRNRGLDEPDAVRNATAEYRSEMDELGDFFEEACLLNSEVQVKASDLYSAYAKRCKDLGSHPMSVRKFGLVMTEKGFEKVKTNGVVWRKGIGLLEVKSVQDQYP